MIREESYWMTVREACEKFECSDTLIHRWINQGRLRSTKKYGRTLIKRDSKRPPPLERGQGAWLRHKNQLARKKRENETERKLSAEKKNTGISAALRRLKD